MTQQYQTPNHYLVMFLVTFWSLNVRIFTCIKALKALVSSGCGRGEIGKHKGLKIPRPHGLAGSSPAARTIKRSGGAFNPPEGR